jgi:hypothetical protein
VTLKTFLKPLKTIKPPSSTQTKKNSIQKHNFQAITDAGLDAKASDLAAGSAEGTF